ncbi:MAG: Bcr/CflA family multidrug efflux MFS transporter [Ilyomonas sp.]
MNKINSIKNNRHKSSPFPQDTLHEVKEHERRSSRFIIILILGLLSAIGPFSIDMYLPGFPQIAEDLHTTVGRVSLSLSSFFIGISFGQLLYGPLLDRYGRKKPLYVGIVLYLFTSVGCVFAHSVNALIILRFFQALGGCAGMVASRAMVRDIFPVEENAKIFSLLMLVIGVSPIIAPTVGGFVATHFGWQYIFIVLSVLAATVLIMVHFYLQESRSPDKNFSLKPKPILHSFFAVLKEPQFYTYALTGSLASSGLYAYIAGSPFVFMELYKVTEQQYGWIFALIAVGLIVSSQLNTVMLRRYKSEQIIRIALLCQTLTGVALLIGALTNWLGLFSSIALIFVFLCCQGFTFPNSSALSLAPFAKRAGSASSLMGAIQMGIGTLTSAAVGVLSNNTSIPMTSVMAFCAVSAFTVLLIGGKIIRYRMKMKNVEEQAAEIIITS